MFTKNKQHVNIWWKCINESIKCVYEENLNEASQTILSTLLYYNNPEGDGHFFNPAQCTNVSDCMFLKYFHSDVPGHEV